MRLKQRVFWLGILAAALALGASDQLSLTLAVAKTQVEFSVGDVLHTVHGTFQLKRGQIGLDPVTGQISGEIVIDAASGNSGNGARDRRMTRHILEAQRYPEIVFAPAKLVGNLPDSGSSTVQISGSFRIHGEAHEMSIPFAIQCSGNEWIVSGKFVVPYVDWGMKNPSTLFLRVNDKVEINIKTVVGRTGAAGASAALGH